MGTKHWFRIQTIACYCLTLRVFDFILFSWIFNSGLYRCDINIHVNRLHELRLFLEKHLLKFIIHVGHNHKKYHLLLRYMLIFLLTWMSMLYAAKDIKKIIIYINKTHFRLIIRLYNIWNWIINTYFYWICLIHRTLYTCTV